MRAQRLLLAAVLALAVCACGAQTDVDRSLTSERLREAIDAGGLRAHLEALQGIADAHGGIRAAGTPGYDASSAYVLDVLRDAGYEAERQEFEFPSFEVTTQAVIVAGQVTELAGGDDLRAMIYSGSGDLRAPVVGLDYNVDAQPGPFRGAGCEPDDWDGFQSGAIALVQPGPCLRREQVLNGQAAGAAAIVVAYPSWLAGEARRPTLINPDGIDIPALAATHPAGRALARVAGTGEEVSLSVETRIEARLTANVVAELVGAEDEAVVIGAHLDSVFEGPGVNDNGSGVAAILELARASVGLQPRHTVGFAFWSAEELGVVGSTHYVEELGGEAETIGAYLNLDMLGSPNGVRYVYADEGAPSGSEEIGELFTAYFEERSLRSELLDLGGGSDHGPFMRAGIPVGGVFSGASDPLREGQAAADGGQVGEPHDRCYHLECDTVENVDVDLATELTHSVAHVTARLADRLPE